MFALIDYGMGNLSSVRKAFAAVGADDIQIINKPSMLKRADALILPGVGNFGDGIKNLQDSGFADAIISAVNSGRPLIGICLGMQLLMETSEEAPECKGLGVFKGKSLRFKHDMGLKVPHIGWNSVDFTRSNKNTENSSSGEYFYFVHSYYVKPEDDSIVLGTTDYGIKFCSCLGRDNIFATQFHPEKSQEAGLKIIRQFVNFRRSYDNYTGN